MIQIKNLNIKYAKDNKISVSDFEVSAGTVFFYLEIQAVEKVSF